MQPMHSLDMDVFVFRLNQLLRSSEGQWHGFLLARRDERKADGVVFETEAGPAYASVRVEEGEIHICLEKGRQEIRIPTDLFLGKPN